MGGGPAVQARHFHNGMNDKEEIDQEALLDQCLQAASLALQTIENYVGGGETLRGVAGPGVYVGVSGIAMMYLVLGDLLSHVEVGSREHAGLQRHLPGLTPQHCLAKADTWLSVVPDAGKAFPPGRVTFLEGSAGPLALRAIVAAQMGREGESKAHVAALHALADPVSRLPEGDCELLYGRAGYIWALAFVERMLGQGTVKTQVARDTMDQIISAGTNVDLGSGSDQSDGEGAGPEGAERRATKDGRLALTEFGYSWSWHKQAYLGAVHGYAGIVLSLLQCGEECGYDQLAYMSDLLLDDPRSCAKRVVEGLVGALTAGGNLPRSATSQTDRLVQVCHGAPGMVLLLAHVVPRLTDLTRPTRAEAAEALRRASDCVWKRGLLSKGVGLCHGIAGNGLALLSAWRALGDPALLARGQQYARFAAEHWEQLLNIPDRPLSLFEGLSGCVVLWMSMLCPRQSHLPGVELPPKIDQEGVDASKGFRQIRSPMGDKGGGSRFRSRRESRG